MTVATVIAPVLLVMFCETGGGRKCDTSRHPMPDWPTCMEAVEKAKLSHGYESDGSGFVVACVGEVKKKKR